MGKEENANDKKQAKLKNKKIMIICTIVLLLLIAVVVTGIIITNKNFGKEKNIAGKYSLIEMSEDGEEYTKEDIEMLKSFGLTVSLELRDDKTGTIEMFGETKELTYDNDNFIVKDEITPYTYENNKVSIEQDKVKMTFEKNIEE